MFCVVEIIAVLVLASLWPVIHYYCYCYCYCYCYYYYYYYYLCQGGYAFACVYNRITTKFDIF